MNAIVPGSIGAIAEQTGKSIAETMMAAEVVIIIDTSGSMCAEDSRGGRSRYNVACDELRELQAHLPGKIAVINFSDDVRFEPSGHPFFLSCGTNLAKALRFAKQLDLPGMRFILISDGGPDSEDEALTVARTYKNRIDVIYVGPEDHPHGREFLTRLSRVTGGQAITADRAKELKAGVLGLLGAGK
jgi:hypothetical protein